MPVITEKKLRAVVRNYLTENRLVEQPESTDELQKIVVKLGLGDAVNKSVLAAAMKAGSGRNAKQNKVIADLFMGMLDKGDEIVKIIPLLKKAASEESTTPAP